MRLQKHPKGCACSLCADNPAAVDTACALSVSMTIEACCPTREWERRMGALFDTLFPYLEVGGVAAGHLKGAVCQGEAKLFLSKTVRERIDLRRTAEWERQDALAQPVVTVNLISILPVALTEETLAGIVRNALSGG